MLWQRTDRPSEPTFVQTVLRQHETRLIRPYDLRYARDDGVGLTIVRGGGLGDVLMTTPALRQLQRDVPGLQVTYYTTSRSAEALYNNPNVHQIRQLTDFQEQAQPVFVDLRHYVERRPDCRTRARVDLFADALGLALQDHHLDLFLEPDELAAGALRVKHLARPRIGVCPEASAANRDWKFVVEALPQLKDRGSVVWCARRPAPEGVDLEVLDREGPRAWAQVLAALDVVIAVDTGRMHLVAALQHQLRSPKLLALMGVSSAANRLKGCRGPLLALMPQGLACGGCCEYRFQRRGCGFVCQDYMTVERVIRGLDVLLKNGEGIGGLIDDQT